MRTRCVFALVLATACDPPSAKPQDAGPEIVVRAAAEATIESLDNWIIVRARRLTDGVIVAEARVLPRPGIETLRLGDPDENEPSSACVASRDFGNQIDVSCIAKAGALAQATVTLIDGALAVDGAPAVARDASFVTILRSQVPRGDAAKLAARWERDVDPRCKGIAKEKSVNATFVVDKTGLTLEVPDLKVKREVHEGALDGCAATVSDRSVMLTCAGEAGSRTIDTFVFGSSVRFSGGSKAGGSITPPCEVKVVFQPKAQCQALKAIATTCTTDAR